MAISRLLYASTVPVFYISISTRIIRIASRDRDFGNRRWYIRPRRLVSSHGQCDAGASLSVTISVVINFCSLECAPDVAQMYTSPVAELAPR